MSDYNLWRWPSVLTLVSICVFLIGLLVLGAVKGNVAIGVGLVLAALGLPLLWLASKEEANLWREAGVWLSLFAYAGILAGAIMDVMGMGDVLAFTAVGLGVIALPFTVLAFSQADHQDPADAAEERRAEARRGLERGATVGAGVLVAVGLLVIVISPHDFTDGGRAMAVLALVVLAAALFVGGAYLHAPPRSARLGLVMLLIGAVGLTLVSVLDTIPTTTISGPAPPDWNVDVSGIAFWFLPGAALALVAAIVGTTVGGHGLPQSRMSVGPIPPRASASH